MNLLYTGRKVIDRWRRRQLQRRMADLRCSYPESAASIDSLQNHPEFDSLRHRIRSAGTACLTHFGNGYTHQGGYHLQQNPDEFAALILLLRSRAPIAQYLEIGSASGGACLMLYQTVDIRHVVSLDDGRHPDAGLQSRHFAQIPDCQRFLGDSHGPEARRFLMTQVRPPLDVAFIDGDHSYDGVTQDIQLVLPCCRRGTLLILHDTVACEGVAQAWCELLQSRRAIACAEFLGAEKPLGIGVAEVR
ncbi:MAG: class I SAM-dependent methyltransferase [Pirellulales bacterium]